MTKFEHLADYPDLLRGRFNSFITTSFDDSMTVEMQLREMIRWIKQNIEMTNSQTDYLNHFIETFDSNLYTTTEEILNHFFEDERFNEILTKIFYSQPSEVFNSFAELTTKYPKGSSGFMYVLTSNGYDMYIYDTNTQSWKNLGSSNGLKLTNKDSDQLKIAIIDRNNWIKNSSLFETNDIPFTSRDGAKGSVITTNSKRWFLMEQGTTNTQRQQIASFLSLDNDRYYYGGTGSMWIKSKTTSEIYFYLVVDSATTSIQVPIKYFTLQANDVTLVKFDIPRLSDKGIALSEIKQVTLLIKPIVQTDVYLQVAEMMIQTNAKTTLDVRTETSENEAKLTQRFTDNYLKSVDSYNWIDNSVCDPTKPIPYIGQDNLISTLVAKGKHNHVRFTSGETNTGRQKTVIPLNILLNSDRFYYGGEASIKLKALSSTLNFSIRVLLINKSNQEKYVELSYLTLNQNQQVTFKCTIPKLSGFDGFDFSNMQQASLIIQPTQQNAISYEVGSCIINSNSSYTVDNTETRKNIVLDSEIKTLDYSNWIKNASFLGTALPVQAQDGLKGSVVVKSSRNWYQVETQTNLSNRQKLAIFPTVIDDSDKYYYGGAGKLTIRNEAVATNFDMFVTVYTATEEKQFLINSFYLLPNQNMELKYTIPKLSESGFAFTDVTQVVISIRPENQDTIKFRVTDLSIQTLPSYVRDITKKELSPLDTKKSIFPRVDLSGDFDSLTATGKLMMPFRYQNQEFVVEGVSETKWQGNSSKNLPKKNIRIKLYDDEQKTNKKKVQLNQWFPKTEKYNLKANYIDRFQVRNLMNSMLSYQMFATRPTLSEPIDSIPFGGQIKGFPCTVYINNEFYGLFTFNTAKDTDMLLLSDEENQLAIQGFLNSRGAKFYENHVTVAVDGTTEDFEILFPEEIPNESQQSDIDRLFTFVNSSTDEEFVRDFEMYYDLTSVIDWMLLIDFTAQTDMNGKNIIHVTYDRKKWFAVPYDQDNSYGVHFTGEIETDTDFNILDPSNNINKLFKRVLTHFSKEVVKRYDELVVANVLTTQNITTLYQTFIQKLPEEYVELDKQKWSMNKSYTILDYDRTFYLIQKRAKLIANHIDLLR